MKTDVCVIGAGPTGLALAYELQLAGCSVVLLERGLERTGQCKALNLQPRTAEMFHMRGILEPLRERAMGMLPDGHYAGLPLRYDTLDTSFGGQLGIPQPKTEAFLESLVSDVVHRGYEVVDLEQDADGVVVHCANGEQVQARYVVACDGGRSRIRKLLDAAFPGLPANWSAVVADVSLAEGAEHIPRIRSVASLFEGLKRGAGILPIGDGHFRMTLTGERQRNTARDVPITFEEVAEGLAIAVDEPVRLGEVLWASRFTDASRQVENYRHGRVFLAGDAAHIHNPAGGQGLNLGIQDAMNLGWKLAAVLRGEAEDDLLDTYHSERHPVGARVLQNTRAQGALLEQQRTEQGRALREFVGELLRMPDVNDKVAGMISGLDICYATDCEHPVAGQRIHDFDGVVFPRFRTGEWVLLHDDEIPQLPAPSVLVRPDGYVHWAGPRSEAEEAFAQRYRARREGGARGAREAAHLTV